MCCPRDISPLHLHIIIFLYSWILYIYEYNVIYYAGARISIFIITYYRYDIIIDITNVAVGSSPFARRTYAIILLYSVELTHTVNDNKTESGILRGGHRIIGGSAYFNRGNVIFEEKK